MHFAMNNSVEGVAAALYTFDNLFETTNYLCSDSRDPQPGYGYFDTGKTRTTGWHKLEFLFAPDALVYKVDGDVVHTAAAMQVDKVSLSVGAPYWRPAWQAHFDDFSASYTSPGQD